jgi:hypothetical protein
LGLKDHPEGLGLLDLKRRFVPIDFSVRGHARPRKEWVHVTFTYGAEAGVAKLVGTDLERIVRILQEALKAHLGSTVIMLR